MSPRTINVINTASLVVGSAPPLRLQLSGLYKWQKDAYEMLSVLPHAEMVSPTGSGKSRVEIYCAADHCASGKKTLIVTPQHEIAAGFNQKLLIQTHRGDYEWSPQICDVDEGGKLDQLRTFLTRDNPGAFIATHAALARLEPEIRKNDEMLRNLLLIVDEAHHGRADVVADQVEGQKYNKIGQIVSIAVKLQHQGTRVLLASATPFRGDQRPIISEEVYGQFFKGNRYTRGVQEHLREHGLQVIPYLRTYRGAADAYLSKLKEAFSDKKRSGKSFIFMPHTLRREVMGEKDRHVEEICGALNDLGFTVLDLVSESSQAANKKYLCERRQANKEVDEDVILAMNLGQEGVDIPSVDHVVVIGGRDSLTQICQTVGRAFRPFPGKKNITFDYIVHNPRIEGSGEEVEDEYNRFMKVIFTAYAALDVFDVLPQVDTSAGTKDSPSDDGDGLTPDVHIELMEVWAAAREAAIEEADADVPDFIETLSTGEEWEEFYRDDVDPEFMRRGMEEGFSAKQIDGFIKRRRRDFFRLLAMSGTYFSDDVVVDLTYGASGIGLCGENMSPETLKAYAKLARDGKTNGERAFERLLVWCGENGGLPKGSGFRRGETIAYRHLKRFESEEDTWYRPGTEKDCKSAGRRGRVEKLRRGLIDTKTTR